MYKKNLALNNPQWLIYNKTQPTNNLTRVSTNEEELEKI